MLHIVLAEPPDADILSKVQKRSFDSDALHFQQLPEGGPSGYDSSAWQTEAIRFLFNRYSAARKWTLDTPSWAVRNQYLYTKLGFVKIGESPLPGSSDLLFEYERLTSGN